MHFDETFVADMITHANLFGAGTTFVVSANR